MNWRQGKDIPTIVRKNKLGMLKEKRETFRVKIMPRFWAMKANGELD